MIGQENHTFVKLDKEYTVGSDYAIMKHHGGHHLHTSLFLDPLTHSLYNRSNH